MRSVQVLLICLLVTAPSLAYDIQYVALDPLPDNAEEIAREYLAELIAERYPNNYERITIGEAVPLYVYENEIKALSFVVKLDADDKPSLEDQFRDYLAYDSLSNEYHDYKVSNSLHDDDIVLNYIQSISDLSKTLFNTVNVVIAFINHNPTYIGNIRSFIFGNCHFNISVEDSFLGYGLVFIGHGLSICKISYSEFKANYKWHSINSNYVYNYTDIYPIDVESFMYKSLFIDSLFGGVDVKPPLGYE